MMVMRRMREICEGQAMAYGVRADLDYNLGYPATVNDAGKAEFAAGVAEEVAKEAIAALHNEFVGYTSSPSSKQ